MNKNLFLIIVALLVINLVSATIEIGNLSHDIDLTYTPTSPLKGWINFSMFEEPADTLVTAFDSSITLEELLDANLVSCKIPNPYECSCLPSDCESGYRTIGSSSSSKTYSINNFKTELIGIRLQENVSKVSDFRFNISSNADSSCTNPLLIDLLDDGSIDFKITTLVDETCFIENPWGCFEVNNVTGNTTIKNTPLCERITVPSAKGYKIGAVVAGNQPSSFTMSLNGNECAISSISSSGEISCNVELDSELEGEREVEVCIFADEGSEDNFIINFEDNDVCGFIDSSQQTPHDFEIFAKPLKYSAPGDVGFHDGLFQDETNLSAQALTYLENRYDAKCESDCIIPIRIYSGIDQVITVRDMFIDYDVEELNPGGSDEDQFYDINSTVVLYTTPFIEYDLDDLGLLTPLTINDDEFDLEIGDETLENNISLLNISTLSGIVPTTASALVSTKFFALVSDTSNLTYTWDFGDNSKIETTNVNSIEHTYAVPASYSVTVNITNAQGTTSKSTSISVIAPFQAINDTIKDYRKRLKTIDDKLFVLPDKIQERIEAVLDTADLKSAINRLEGQYKELFVVDTEDLVKIMKQLNDLNVPSSFDSSLEIKPSKFFQGASRLDIPIMGEYGAGSAESDKLDGYPAAINVWLEENLDVTLESKSYSFYFVDGTELTALTHITLKLNPITSVPEVFMVIDGDTNNIRFLGDYSEREIDPNHFGITFRDLEPGTETKIEFLHPERTEVLNPPVSMSPEFRFLELGFSAGVCNNNGICEDREDYNNCRADCKPVTRTIIWLIVLLVLALIAYIGLQEWYKRKYQTHLFKNPSQLFNLITFMSNGKSQGLSKDQIFKQLRERKWNNEQLNFAWKKLNNQRTGMFEIPIFRMFEKKKMEKEMAKRRALGLA